MQGEYSGLGQELGNLVAVLVGSAMLVLAMRASGINRRGRIGVWITILICFSAHVLAAGIQIVSDQPLGFGNVDTVPIGALVLSLPWFFFVIHRLLRHRRVTLLGAITAYLFTPLTFQYAFLVVDGLTTTPFFGSPRTGPDFMFFILLPRLGPGERFRWGCWSPPRPYSGSSTWSLSSAWWPQVGRTLASRGPISSLVT